MTSAQFHELTGSLKSIEKLHIDIFDMDLPEPQLILAIKQCSSLRDLKLTAETDLFSLLHSLEDSEDDLSKLCQLGVGCSKLPRSEPLPNVSYVGRLVRERLSCLNYLKIFESPPHRYGLSWPKWVDAHKSSDGLARLIGTWLLENRKRQRGSWRPIDIRRNLAPKLYRTISGEAYDNDGALRS